MTVHNFKDLTGQRFGFLTVIKRIANSKSGRIRYLCRCDCGNYKEVQANHLVNGKIISCGCFRVLSARIQETTHGLSNSRIYKIFSNMKKRCYNKNNQDYKHYGGRGITICEEWKSDFMNFYNWAMVNGYDECLSIDRIDVNGNYEPNNCRWITMEEQHYNTRKVIKINHNGVSYTLLQISKLLGLSKRMVYYYYTTGSITALMDKLIP